MFLSLKLYNKSLTEKHFLALAGSIVVIVVSANYINEIEESLFERGGFMKLH